MNLKKVLIAYYLHKGSNNDSNIEKIKIQIREILNNMGNNFEPSKNLFIFAPGGFPELDIQNQNFKNDIRNRDYRAFVINEDLSFTDLVDKPVLRRF
ncbi:MAG: hypothetical protein NTW25_03820 [Candidatus Kapabacteria bacterium]|nr:hypothetical protein [Candidatus Kapabacteria bacterium]